MNLKWKVGDTTITKITEITYPEFPDLIPAATPEVVKKVPWLFPHFVTLEGKLSVSIHSLVVDTPGAKLVVDTCIGNGRNREPLAIMSNLSTSYLEDMSGGLPPGKHSLRAVYAFTSRSCGLEYAPGQWQVGPHVSQGLISRGQEGHRPVRLD
jgi:hypothetical protein